MTLPSNGTVKRIVAGVVSALIIAVVTALIANQNEVSTLKVRMTNVEKAIEENKGELKDLRKENRDDHGKIGDQLRELLQRGK